MRPTTRPPYRPRVSPDLRVLRALALLLALPLGAAGQSLTFTSDQLVIVASASPNTPFLGGPSNPTLTIDQSSGDYGGDGVSHALLRFLDYNVPSAATVLSARLEFFTADTTNGPINVYQMTSNWTTATTWNSLGGNGITPGTESSSSPLAAEIDPVELEPISFDVTQAVLNWQGGAANFGFGVINTSTDGWDIATIDAAPGFAPRLVVDAVFRSPVELQVSRSTGFARLVSVAEGDTVELRALDMQSTSGVFDAASWQATNLTARGVDTTDPNASGQRWDVLDAVSTRLTEAYLLGGTSLAPGETLSLGRVMAPLAPGAPTPALTFELATTNYLGGAANLARFANSRIVFTEFAIPGDYNADGAVNAADYTVWRDTLGSSSDLRADGDGDGAVGQGDYAAWRASYGYSAGSAAVGVPEPTATAIAGLAVLGVASSKRRR
ncbi:MAG: DNRLRE domain-containing protein [Lacipirellulaceae bacterium]